MVQINGENVPLDECDWVLTEPCGCAESIVLAVMRARTLATEADAWEYFYRADYRLKAEREKRIRQDQAAGWRLGAMRRKDAVAAITKACPHEGGGLSWLTV
jgi:hypothetical protein